MTTIRLSWVSFVLFDNATDALKLGLPVIVLRDAHELKQALFAVEF